jgi:ACS family hexuronate transporter-like MFS transporter
MTDAEVRPSPWRWWVCGLLFLATVLNYMDRIALNQTAVRIKFAFNLDDKQYSLLESGFSVAFAVGTLFTGWLVDRVGVRLVYPAAVLGWSLAGFLCGFASGYWMLFAFRVMLGLFEAGNWPCGVRTVRQIMPPAERSFGSSLFQSGTAIGAVITPVIVLLCLRWADPHEGERTAALAATGGLLTPVVGFPTDAWQVPFRVIGGIGVVWVLLWLFTVPRRALDPLPDTSTKAESSFAAVFRDRRYWVLVAVIIGVNTCWHTFRVWLPLFLQKELRYTEVEMTWTTTAYYLVGDIGSWTIGLMVLMVGRRGGNIHTARLCCFAGCTGLVLVSAAFPLLPRGWMLTAALLMYGFGALGLFPTYFALSQEVSGRHQGKVTGSLGFINAMYLAGMFRVQGGLNDANGSYLPVLTTAWVAPAIALVILLLFWRRNPA